MTEILEKSGNFMRGKKWEPCPKSGGGTPSRPGQGVLWVPIPHHPDLVRGYPCYPPSELGWGTCHQPEMGYPLRPGTGYPLPRPGMGYPLPGPGMGYPPT